MTKLWDKAIDARDSARLLEQAGQSDGAANRAYFAMFHAARYALWRVDQHLMHSRRHASVIGRFSKHIVIERGADRALGRAFNDASILRMKADYDADGLDLALARRLVRSCEAFLSAIEAMDFESR